MSRNKMNKLASKLKAMYLTENPINRNNHWNEWEGYKYFICFHNTHKIYTATTNINDMIVKLESIIEIGARDEGNIFY